LHSVLVAAAVCPHPPLLVPGVGSGAAPELDDLRGACDVAVGDLLGVGADLTVVVGDAPVVGPYHDGAWGTLRPYGAPVDVGRGEGEAGLPLSLTIGRWLLDRAAPGEDPPRRVLLFGVSADSPPERCAQLGEALAGGEPRVALLVMGDGTARRVPKGPGYLDPRAEPFDAQVARALASGDPQGLAALDTDLAGELLVAGRAAWQVLAGAAVPGPWRGEVTYDAAPYGVGYLVASWRPA
jgi:hypothetical protein